MPSSRMCTTLPIDPTRRDADAPQHHLQRLPRAGDHPAEPAARHRGGHHRARRGSPPTGLLAAEGHRRLLLPRHRRLLHPLPRRRGGWVDGARRPPRPVPPSALTILGARPLLARSARCAAPMPPDPVAARWRGRLPSSPLARFARPGRAQRGEAALGALNLTLRVPPPPSACFGPFALRPPPSPGGPSRPP